MPAVFETGYDDRDWNEKDRTQRLCEGVLAALAAIGIAADIADDPPWMDAGELSGYFQGCAWGALYVMVADGDLERAKAVAAKAAGSAPEA